MTVPAKRQFWNVLAAFIPWLLIVIWLSFHHAMGRDDVRALSLALQGTNVAQMLRAVHGEGHPAIWFLLLRGAHSLVPRPQVLPAVSVIVAAAAALVLLIWSPFSMGMKALILFGHMCLIEYSVVPRDYGIAMLALFAFVAIYDTHRERDLWPGVILFLLANCHLLAILLVGCLLLLWLIDILTGGIADRRRAFRLFAANAVLAAAGVFLCIRLSLPTFNDAAKVAHAPGTTFHLLLQAIFLPAEDFRELVFPAPLTIRLHVLPAALLSGMMYGSLLGLIRRPGALLAGAAMLLGLSGFFALLSPGGYRHEALWLVMLIGTYWLALARRPVTRTAFPDSGRRLIQRQVVAGTLLFVAILLLQMPSSIHQGIRTARNGPPYSRSRDLAQLVKARPDLHDAIIIADPDYLVEPLPYYISNPTYLMRENRYGNVVHFTRHARLSISLGDILATARMLHQQTGKPIIILLEHRLHDVASALMDTEGYEWVLTVKPDDIRSFLESTQFIMSFGPAMTDETFDVYTFGVASGSGRQAGAATRCVGPDHGSSTVQPGGANNVRFS